MKNSKKLKLGLAVGLVLIGLVTIISINNTNVNIFHYCLADTAAGWDPGLTKKLAAGIYPDSTNYFELCPDGPNGKCYGEISAGGGFYTIANDELCKINSGNNFYAGEYNQNVPCPFEFSWKQDNDDIVASLKIDTTDFTSPITPNIYLGLQENLPYGDVYLGVDEIADINEISKAHLKFKASYCFGSATDQADIDSYRRARFFYHIVWYNSIKEKSYGVSINLLDFKQHLDDGSNIGADNYLFYETDEANNWVVQLGSKAWGIIPQDYQPIFDSSENCSFENQESDPWIEASIPISDILNKLADEGYLSEDDLDGPVTCLIIGGAELWGRLSVSMEVKNHYITEDICYSDNTDSSGKCSVDCGASQWCDGLTPLEDIPYCAKGGNTAIHDRCSSACQLEDRPDNICRKTGIADCTGSFTCDLVSAGDCINPFANSLKKCNSNCQEISSCGDGICNCGENSGNCLEDCQRDYPIIIAGIYHDTENLQENSNILNNYLEKIPSNINGIESKISHGLTNKVIDNAFSKNFIVMAHTSDKSSWESLADWGVNMIAFDEIKYNEFEEFTGSQFNNIKNRIKAINPNIQVGIVEPFINQYIEFFSEGADPDFIGLEQYVNTNGESIYPTYNEFIVQVGNKFPNAKIHIWINDICQINKFLEKADVLILFNVDNNININEWPPFSLDDIEIELEKVITGKCSASCGASQGCDGVNPNSCSLNLLKKCDSNCQEISSCGDGDCNCGETSENCFKDCPIFNHLPIGNLDSADQTSITGWAYDANAGTNPIDVHIYIGGNLIGSSTANLNRPDLVSAGVCPDPNHGFSFSTPSLSIGDHTVSVYAINQPEGTNPELEGSPKIFTVTSSDTAPPTGSISINSGDAKTNAQSVNLSISASDPSGLSEMKISNSNDFNSVVAETYNTIKSFILSTGDGLKTVYIWFKDTIGNWNTSPYLDTIILDSTSPVISNISVSNITTSTATINFQTNEPTTSHIEYGLTSSYGSTSALDSALATIHSISLSGLSADTEYHFKIISKDELENESNSIDQTFKTIGLPDTIPPSKITDLSSANISQTSADLLWTSKGDDNNIGTSASYDIRYSLRSPLGFGGQALQSWWDSSTQLTGEPIPSFSGSEEYISVGLSSNTNYYFIIKSADEVPNWSDYSNILLFKTLAQTGGGGGGGTVSDTTAPNQPKSFKAIPADSQITLNWKNPSDSDFVRVILFRSTKPIDDSKSAADLSAEEAGIYEGNKEQYTDINLNNDKTYYYSIFAYDKKPNYSEILSISSKPIEGKESIEIPNPSSSYPEGTLLKTTDSFKIYIIINQKKKWIPTPEVFETLGYQWTEIIEIEKNQLDLIPDYEDNLIRAINDFKVYLIVNGIKRHIPNPEIFLNYGFKWDEVKDVNQETINQYIQANLIKESKKEEIYYLCPTRKIKRWLRSPEIFNSYSDNDWNNIQVISKYEMEHYPESNLIKLNNSNDVYLIEGNKKRLIKSVEEFEREGLDWNLIMGVGEVEFNWFK